MTEISATTAAAGEAPDAEPTPGSGGFEELYRRHFRSLAQLATLLGADDPDNVVQESFVRLQTHETNLRDPAAAAAYLRVTVCNLSRSRLRHLLRARRHLSRLVPPVDASVEQAAELREEHREVLGALHQLPRRPREVLILRYWCDLSEADIAATLGVSAGAVKSYASRGLAAIEGRLRGQS